MALDPVTDVSSQNEGNSRPVSLKMSSKKESMTEVTSATVSGRNSEKIPQSEEQVINLVKKIQEMSHPEIEQKALEVFQTRGYGANDRLDLEQAQGAISAFCFADLDIAFGDQQELLKEIEEVIKAQGGSVDL